MKVRIRIEQTVEYVMEVRMTAAELDEWDNRLKDAGRFGDGKIAESMLEVYGPEHGSRLGEPNDWGELSVETFEPIEPKKKRRSTSKTAGVKP